MARPSTYVLLLQAQQAIKQLQKDLYVSKGFTLQQAMDMAMIALHDEFGFGPKYQARFEAAFRRTFVEYGAWLAKQTEQAVAGKGTTDDNG